MIDLVPFKAFNVSMGKEKKQLGVWDKHFGGLRDE